MQLAIGKKQWAISKDILPFAVTERSPIAIGRSIANGKNIKQLIKNAVPFRFGTAITQFNDNSLFR